MPRKGVLHATMTNDMRIALCQYKKDHPSATQKALIKWLEDNYKITVSQATISTTLQRSAEILTMSDDANLKAKRQRTVKYPAMESALVDWFRANQERANVSGKLIHESGTKILDRLYPGHEPFEFSNGWLEAFKARHNIRLSRRAGKKSRSLDTTAVADVQELLNMYDWKDIYSMDETGLFYRMQADSLLATKQLEGRKQNKERITLVVCCNGDGNDKLPLWVIGKHEKPRCFGNVNMDVLGCIYRSSAKVRMTRAIFLEWLKLFDLHVYGRNVLLLLDDVPLVQLPDQEHLHNTRVVCLPPNMKSKIRPCNAGIARNLKAYYRVRLNRMLLQRLEDSVEDPEKIDVLAAIQMVVRAWRSDVRPTVIVNCFRHCKIRATEEAAEDFHENDLIDPDVIVDLQSQIRQFRYPSPMDIQSLLKYPGEEVITCTPDLDDIIEKHLRTGDAPERDIDEADDSEEVPAVSLSEAHKCIETIERFWLQQSDCDISFIAALQRMKDSVSIIRSRQMVYDDSDSSS